MERAPEPKTQVDEHSPLRGHPRRHQLLLSFRMHASLLEVSVRTHSQSGWINQHWLLEREKTCLVMHRRLIPNLTSV